MGYSYLSGKKLQGVAANKIIKLLKSSEPLSKKEECNEWSPGEDPDLLSS